MDEPSSEWYFPFLQARYPAGHAFGGREFELGREVLDGDIEELGESEECPCIPIMSINGLLSPRRTYQSQGDSATRLRVPTRFCWLSSAGVSKTSSLRAYEQQPPKMKLSITAHSPAVASMSPFPRLASPLPEVMVAKAPPDVMEKQRCIAGIWLNFRVVDRLKQVRISRSRSCPILWMHVLVSLSAHLCDRIAPLQSCTLKMDLASVDFKVRLTQTCFSQCGIDRGHDDAELTFGG